MPESAPVWTAPRAIDDSGRLEAARGQHVLDTPHEERFDRFTRLVARTLGVPMALITVADEHRIWYKSAYGVDALETRFSDIPPSAVFGAVAVSHDQTLVVEDATLDSRFASHPDVVAGRIRFYAGVPLRSPSGYTIGTLCALDAVPRSLTANQLATLEDLAAAVVDELELTRQRAALERSEAQTQQVLDATRTGFFAVDSQWRLTHMNESAEPLMQRRREDLMGQNMLEVFSESASATFYNESQRAMHEQVAVQFEEYSEPSGRWFDVRFFPFEGGLSAYIDDVTEKVEAQQRLETSERRYRALVEATSSIVWRMSADGHSLLDVIGGQLNVDHLVGADLKVTAANWLDFVHPDDRVRTQKTWADTLHAGVPAETEYRLVLPDGSIRWFAVHAVPVRDEAGAVKEWMGAHTDISKRKQAEDALARSEARFRSLVQNSYETIAQVRADGTILYVSPSINRTAGFTTEERTGHSNLELIHPEDQGRMQEAMAAVLAGGAEATVEYRYLDARREWRRMESHLTKMTGGSDVDSVVINSRDVTDARRASEEALRAREHRIRRMMDTALDAVIVMDAREIVLEWNPQAEVIFGWTREEAVGTAMTELIVPPLYRAAHTRGIKHFLATGEGPMLNRRIEITALHREGREFPVELAVTPMEVEGGWVFGAFMRDVTERRQAEEARHESENRYRTLSHLVQTFAYCFDVPADGSRPTIAWITGSVTEVLGRPVSDFQGTTWGAVVSEASRARSEERLRAVLSGQSQIDDLQILDKNGEPRWVRMVVQPEVDAATGRVVRIYGAGQDVTAQKEAEQELVAAREHARKSEAELRQIADMMPQIVWTSRPDGSTDYLNAQWFDYSGMPREGIQGCNLFEYLHPDDAALTTERWQHSLRTGDPFEVEYRFKRASDGAYRWFIGRAEGMRGEDGEIERWFGTCTDMHELWETRAKAEEMTRLKEAFLANMSHEIRTPLTSVLGFAEVLRDMVDEESLGFVDIIIAGGLRLKDTLTSVLELSQLQAGRIELHPARLDVAVLLRETVELLRPQACKKGVTITLASGDTPVVADLDRTALGRILINLAGNAVKFTNTGGEVHLFAAVEEGHVTLKVSDTGIGISEAFLPHLFEEFRQESLGLGRSHEGSGLGLTITKRMVDIMGGTISVESKKGHGTTFTVQLPRGPMPIKPVDPPGHSASPLVEHRRVLLVEDDASTRTLIRHALKEAVIVEAVSAKAALEVAAVDAPFAVVLLDINLGEGISGFDVLPELRKQAACRGARFVAITAYALPGDEERFLAGGFDDYLPKPFTRADLQRVWYANAEAP